MRVIDCSSRESALNSVAALYGVPSAVLDGFLIAFDLDAHYEEHDPQNYGDRELRTIFEASIGRVPYQVDRVHWFHLTRVSQISDFARGIYPLTLSIDDVWQTVLQVFRHTEYEPGLLKMRKTRVPGFHYELKVGNPIHGGPYATLVRDVAIRSREMGNHDYLWLPEIMEDICNGYQEAYGTSIHSALNKALMPVIVKFWSAKQTRIGCVEAALYYLYLTAHDRRLSVNANTCFDGENQTILPEQIISVEAADA